MGPELAGSGVACVILLYAAGWASPQAVRVHHFPRRMFGGAVEVDAGQLDP